MEFFQAKKLELVINFFVFCLKWNLYRPKTKLAWNEAINKLQTKRNFLTAIY